MEFMARRDFISRRKKNEIKAHIGAEISVRSPHTNNTCSIPVLVKNRQGYQNLCRLITLMKMRVPKHAKPGECVVTSEELAAHAKGLICLTGAFDGPIASVINHRGAESAEAAQRAVEWLMELFGKKNVYAELQRHFDREEEARNHLVIELATSQSSAITCYQRRVSRDTSAPGSV